MSQHRGSYWMEKLWENATQTNGRLCWGNGEMGLWYVWSLDSYVFVGFSFTRPSSYVNYALTHIFGFGLYHHMLLTYVVKILLCPWVYLIIYYCQLLPSKVYSDQCFDIALYKVHAPVYKQDSLPSYVKDLYGLIYFTNLNNYNGPLKDVGL